MQPSKGVEADVGVGGAGVRGQLELRDVEGAFGEHIASGALGVIGGPLIFVSSIAVLFGAYEPDGLHALFSTPEGAFEAAFAIYLIVKGLRPSPILDDARCTGGNGWFLRPEAAP